MVKDVLRDTDGTEHVRYNRTYDGLPVVGGDLVVQQSPGGKIAVDPGQRPADHRAVGRTPGIASPGAGAVKVVYAAQHAPVLAWQTTVTGTEPDGTPVRDLVYTDARTGKRLARLPQVMDATGSGQSLYSGTVSLATTLSGSTYQLTDGTRGGHSTYDANNSTSTSRGTLFTDADNAWGTGTTAEPAERGRRRGLRGGPDLGLLQGPTSAAPASATTASRPTPGCTTAAATRTRSGTTPASA